MRLRKVCIHATKLIASYETQRFNISLKPDAF